MESYEDYDNNQQRQQRPQPQPKAQLSMLGRAFSSIKQALGRLLNSITTPIANIAHWLAQTVKKMRIWLGRNTDASENPKASNGYGSRPLQEPIPTDDPSLNSRNSTEIPLGVQNYLQLLPEADRAGVLEKLGNTINLPYNRGNTALHWAVICNDLERVRKLANEQTINKLNEFKHTPVYIATMYSRAEIMEVLVKEFKADPPLHVAVSDGNFETVRLLVEELGVSVDQTNKLGKTALDLANSLAESVESKELRDIVNYLKEKADPSSSAVKVQTEVKGYTPLHSTAPVAEDRIGDFKSLHLAIHNGDIENVRKLANKQTVNQRDYAGQTSLHVAISSMKSKDTEIPEVLIKSGANVDQQDNEGGAPLHWAVNLNNAKAVKLLVKWGAALDLKNKKYKTPLDLTGLSWQDPEIAECLNSALHPQKLDDEEINRPRNKGNTDLHWAAICGDAATVRKFGKAQTVNAVNNSGETALHRAALHGHNEIIWILVNILNANVNAQDNMGSSPLHHAVLGRHVEAVRVLVELGAKVDLQNFCKQTPLDLIEHSNDKDANCEEITRILKEAQLKALAVDKPQDVKRMRVGK